MWVAWQLEKPDRCWRSAVLLAVIISAYNAAVTYVGKNVIRSHFTFTINAKK